jgi:hypothetical protein
MPATPYMNAALSGTLSARPARFSVITMRGRATAVAKLPNTRNSTVAGTAHEMASRYARTFASTSGARLASASSGAG